MRSGLEKIYSDTKFSTDSNPGALDGVKLLFNSSRGHIKATYKNSEEQARGEKSFVSIFDEDGISLEYATHQGHLTLDVPNDQIPPCKDAPDLDNPALEKLRQ